MQYYITAYKTGVYPTISRDRIFLWGRLYPQNATSPDPVPKPTNWQWVSFRRILLCDFRLIRLQTDDYVWAIVQATAPANVSLACGNTSASALVPAGLTKFKLPLVSNCSVNATIARSSQTVLSFAPAGYNFNTTPPSYNFNAFVAASP